jgi:molybdopterin-synthase adenylyltransferase
VSVDRYIKQILFAPFGDKGQEDLKNSKIAIIGLGGLGCCVANNLARSGIGLIRIVDKDKIDITNLHRQLLYDEKDVKRNISKASAAKEKLEAMNSEIIIEAVDQEVNDSNIDDMIRGVDLVIDATDHYPIRELINRACVKKGVPWIFGTAAGSYGMVFNIIPKKTRCFYCIFDKVPLPEYAESSSNIGILNPIVSVIAAVQSSEAIKYLTKKENIMEKRLIFIDLWNFYCDLISVKQEAGYICPVCGYRS